MFDWYGPQQMSHHRWFQKLFQRSLPLILNHTEIVKSVKNNHDTSHGFMQDLHALSLGKGH